MASCASCGSALTDSARFCAACGAATSSESFGGVSAAAEARESRRTVSILFADVVGSTELAESLDAEAVRRHMRDWFATARQAIERHGGTVEKFIGDAVMAVFGVPVIHEDDALRAARAAAELRDADHGPLTIRVGVTTGEVVAGDPGTGQTFVTGDPVNMAARLQAAAAPGTVLIDRATHRMLGDASTVEILPPLHLKGKREPVVAYRLASIDPEGQAIARRMSGPMVGRDSELAILREALAAVSRSSSTRALTVVGQPGIGKSRLVHEFLRGARHTSTVIRGRCLPYGDGITYWPIMELVRDAAGIRPGADPAAARSEIERLLEGVADAGAIAGILAPIAGAGGEIGSLPDVSWAVRGLLEQLAATAPVVAVVDDIQWAEPTLIELLGQVCDRAPTSPILIVCMARPEVVEMHPGWQLRGQRRRSVRLEPLSVEDGAELVRALLGGLPLADASRERIALAADGNPLFIEQLLAMLLDDGFLGREAGRWVARGDLAAAPIPPSISALLAERIDRLPVPTRRLLEQASVVGKTFDQAALGALVGTSDWAATTSALVELSRRELIVAEEGSASGSRWRFRHLLVRDAAYAGIAKADRAALHERLGDWLEAGSLAGTEGGLIVGYHFEQAHRYRSELGDAGLEVAALATTAVSYLHPAGVEASLRGDIRASTSILRRAVDLCPPGARRAGMLYDLAAALWQAGETQAADEVDAEADAVLLVFPDEGIDHRRRLRLATQVAEAGGEGGYEHVTAVAEEAARYYEAVGDPNGIMRALSAAGNAHAFRGEIEAEVALLGRVRSIAAEIGSPGRAARAAAIISNRLPHGTAPVSDALALCEGYLEEVRDNGDARGTILLSIGYLEAMSEASDWQRHFEAVHAIVDEFGLALPLGAADHPMILAMAAAECGQIASVEPILRWSFDELERHRDYSHLATIGPLLAESLLALGRVEEAETAARRGREVGAVDDLDAQVRWRGALAMVASARARHGDAIALAGDAVARIASTEFVVLHADARLWQARVRRASGDERGAGFAAEAALELARQKGNLAGERRIRAFLARLEPDPISRPGTAG
jgi:class 3 adenylate cyclase/tetratricopeptide (TPR) repeat protein